MRLADSLAGDVVRLAVTPLAMYLIAAVAVVVTSQRTDLRKRLHQQVSGLPRHHVNFVHGPLETTSTELSTNFVAVCS